MGHGDVWMGGAFAGGTRSRRKAIAGVRPGGQRTYSCIWLWMPLAEVPDEMSRSVPLLWHSAQ